MAHNLPQIITIDQFQVHLHQVLGQGGFGKVYKAYNNGRPFACKQIKVRHPSMFKCINQELNIMKKLNHPSLVSFTASYSLNNDIYIFMDFCNGGSLRQKLQIVHKKASLEDLALQVFCSILNSLKQLYAQNIIHRDLKPENILIHDNLFKLADFGLSKVLANENVILFNILIPQQLMDSILGTPLYQSPQILKQSNYSSKTDIWSFGILLFEIATGDVPFHAANEFAMLDSIKTSFQRGIFKEKLKPISNQFLKFLLERMIVQEEESRVSLVQLIQMSDTFINQPPSPEHLPKLEPVKPCKPVRKSIRKSIAQVEIHNTNIHPTEERKGQQILVWLILGLIFYIWI